MQSFDFHPTTRVIFDEQSLDQLGELAAELGGGHILIVTDPGIVKVGIVEQAVRSLKEASLNSSVFEDTEENPTTRHSYHFNFTSLM